MLSSPLTLTCTWSVSTRVITCAGRFADVDVADQLAGDAIEDRELVSNHWVV